MLPRCPQLVLLQMGSRRLNTAFAVMAKITSSLGILEPEPPILLDAEPVGLNVINTGRCDFLEFEIAADELDGFAAVLLDDLESIFGIRDRSLTAPEAFGACRGGRRGVDRTSGSRRLRSGIESEVFLLGFSRHLESRMRLQHWSVISELK